MPTMLATQLFETMPGIMRQWRLELDLGLDDELTPGQFRVMLLIQEGHNQVGLLSRQNGASAAAMSKMIDGLVRVGFVEKETSELDRRQVTLGLTRPGQAMARKLRRGLDARLQGQLDSLSEIEKQQVSQSLCLLQKVFRPKTECP